MKRRHFLILIFVFLHCMISAQSKFNGLDMNMGNLLQVIRCKNPFNKS